MKKIALFCFCIVLFLFLPLVFAQLSPTFQEGVRQYQQENYEEAIEIFTQVRQQEPASSQAVTL